MSHTTPQLSSDDSSASGPQPAGSLQDTCARLRRRAFKATSQLSSCSKTTIRKAARRVLKDLAKCIDAVDVHLFRVTIDDTGGGRVGLRHHTGTRISAAEERPLHYFQFRLLPSRIQKCINANQIAKIRGNSEVGGRTLAGLLAKVDCETYYLCPLLIDGQVKGLLGVARRTELPADDNDLDEFFDLLKLIATILLINTQRVRRESRRAKKMAEWRRIADQACDFAITLSAADTNRNTVVSTVTRDENHGEPHHATINVPPVLTISKTTAFGAADATPALDGLRLTDIVLRSFLRDLLEQLAEAVETSEVRTTSFQMALGHAGPRWCLARIEPSRTADSTYATLYLTDNNRDKLLQEEVRELSDHLVKASRLSLLGQMSTEFAHQLNQPLQAILNYANMLQRRIERGAATAENSIATLANIESSVLHSAAIIQRIRDFVKFRTLLTETIRLQEIIDQALMLVIPTARGWNADIIPPDDLLDVEVVVDKAQTTHVLVNLIINALEACQEFGVDRPRIELFVREESGHRRVTVGVKDNGPGLPQKNPDIVFKEFYSGKTEGLGMGLAISREVCESQGGGLTAENNAGQNGCTFFVSMELKSNSGNDTEEINTISIDDNLPID